MVNKSDPSNTARGSLSSLMDGELAPGDVSDACGAWRHDVDARETWHAYHLIGDVLRSDDLAIAPARDEAFLQALRVRLADEPVPLAPAANRSADVQGAGTAAADLPGRPAPRRAVGWLTAPAAVAAGFVAVAGVLVLVRSMSTEVPASANLAKSAPAVVVPPEVVRSAGLDRYLEAHRALANGAPAAGGAEHRVHIVFESK